MYAIVKTGGKQYRVEQGQSLLVERLPVEDGGKAVLQPLLYVDGDNVVDGDALAKVSISARVVGHERGPKLRVVKFKPKRGYKRRTGHRQELTRIEVTEIKLSERRSSSSSSSSSSPKPVGAAAAGEDAAEKPTPTRTRAAKKPAGESEAKAKSEAKTEAKAAPKPDAAAEAKPEAAAKPARSRRPKPAAGKAAESEKTPEGGNGA